MPAGGSFGGHCGSNPATIFDVFTEADIGSGADFQWEFGKLSFFRAPTPSSGFDFSARLASHAVAQFVENVLNTPRVVQFGVYQLDLRAGELRKNGTKLKLSGQPFQVLAILLERPGQVVTRDELQNRLWPDTRSSTPTTT